MTPSDSFSAAAVFGVPGALAAMPNDADCSDAPPPLPIRLAAPPPAPGSTDELGERIAELAAHTNAAMHRMLALLGEFDRRRGWDGFRSCAHWLSWRIGIGRGAAREWVRVARALEELPLISEAMRRGEVSFSKVRAMTRAATSATEKQLLMIARAGTADHVEKLVRALRRCSRAEELESANARHQQRSVTYHHEDGMLVLRARLDPEAGAILVRALEAAQEELYRRRDGRGAVAAAQESFAQMRADALALVAEAALGAGIEGRHRSADHYQVVVHVEEDEASLDEGGHVPAETCRRLACDAGIVAMLSASKVVDDAGEALSVGRKTRSIPPALRRALDHRDDGCQFPACGCRRCDAHHIHHWIDGGETRLDNLLKLCRRHHRSVHEEGYTVERRTDGELVFRRPDGRRLEAAPALRWLGDDPVVALEEVHGRAGLGIGRRTIETWDGTRFEMVPVVANLLEVQAKERAAGVSAGTFRDTGPEWSGCAR
ncbi:MAG TPA: DUF222 domain-containing protein [Thermoanaerobaculia bacterium]|nr:DUF222 domain-containing protein [Thermoanaerobaculia bacterium]